MNFAAGLIRKRLRRPNLFASQSGAAAVEFALVGPLFIFLVCVAFDLSLILFTQSVLNNATRVASRIIQTNQTGGSSTSFSTKLCSEMSGLVPCGSLQFYVQSAASFSSMSSAVTTNGSGNLKFSGTFTPGSNGSDVVVQVAYNRPTIIPWTIHFLNGTSSTLSNSSNLLVATVAFQNEP